MKELIKQIIKEETNRKVRIHNMIKDLGTTNIINMVGGFDRLMEKMDINDPMDFLHLFDGMEVDQSEKNKDWTLFRYKPKHNLMIHDRKEDKVYINYDEIWLILQDFFGLNYSQIEQLTKEWLSEVYNLRGVAIGFFRGVLSS